MLSDVKFRRTAGCKMFESTVYTMKLNKFPIQEVRSENMDLDELMIKSEFNMPFVIKGVSDKLGIRVLDRKQTLSDVANIVGRSFPIKMIEVAQQSEIEGKLGDYADYLKGYTQLHKVINMISLEFSSTAMSDCIQSPQFVRDIDWIDTVWPLERKLIADYPKVQKYCLSGMATSYTDFHIDFGGTSVWYHVVNGRKRFYLIAPTLRNLQLFKSWSVSSTQADTFFGDVVGRAECFEYDLMPGDTFMIPSGWIHAVYTPEDSLVFGGNFLHKNAILRQMQVYQIEGSTRVGKKYRFPLFRQINWYVLCLGLPLALAKFCPDLLVEMGETVPDPDDYDAEVVKMCENLNTAHLFNQFLILVRICDEWTASLTDQYEIEKFLDIAKEHAHIDVMHEVIQKWWTVLESVAKLLDDEADDGGYAHYLHTIRGVEGQINLLDELVVGRALNSFNSQVQGLYDTLNYTPGVKAVKPVEERLTLKLRAPRPQSDKTTSEDKSNSIRLPKENPDAETDSNTSSYEETLPSTVIDSECDPDQLSVDPLPEPEPADLKSLKFKLPRSSKPTQKVLDDFADPVESTPIAAPLKVTSQLPKVSLVDKPVGVVSSLSSASDSRPTPPAVTTSHTSTITKEDAMNKRIQDKNKAKQLLAGSSLSNPAALTSSSSSAVKPTRYKILIAPSKPAPEKINNTVVASVKGESDGQRKYGTRGLKLSTDFLRNAMDVDFSDNPTQGGTTSSDSLIKPEEVLEEEEFHFVDAESRLKGGDEYSEESGKEEEDEEELEHNHTDYDDDDGDDYRDNDYADSGYTVEGRSAKTNKRSQVTPAASVARGKGSVVAVTAKRRRVNAAADEEQLAVKKAFVVDRVSYNSYMGLPQNAPVLPTASTTSSSSNNNFSAGKPAMKPKGGRSAIMKKLGMFR